MPRVIQIVIADDHRLFRHGLRTLLEQDKNFVVIAEAKNGREAINCAAKHSADLFIMDITMPDMNGIEATRRICRILPNVKVLILSMHSHRRFVIETLKAGAKGYLLKDCAFEELLAAIRQIMNGKIYLSADIADNMLREYIGSTGEKEKSAFTTLSVREREILQLIVEGKSTKQIAYSLGISVKTVETHRSKIMNKLKIRTIAELTKYAIREGLTPID
jgi:DNA-binding NarL/FixJ family response regulator